MGNATAYLTDEGNHHRSGLARQTRARPVLMHSECVGTTGTRIRSDR